MSRRLLVFAVLAALLLALVWAAARRGLADAAYYPARLMLNPPKPGEPALRPLDLAVAGEALAQARSLSPANPLYAEEQGRLLEIEASRLARGDPRARALLAQSLERFREAAAMRPGSPYAWSSLALVKYRLGDLDYEFYGALDRAARYGPWEPAVQLALADIGFAGWRWLAAPGKLVTLGAAERAMRWREKDVLELAARHKALPAVCADPLLQARPAPVFCKHL